MQACVSPVGTGDAGCAGGAGGAGGPGGVCRRDIWNLGEIYRIQKEKFWGTTKSKNLLDNVKNLPWL